MFIKKVKWKMFKQRKCCCNPKYETVSSFYTYKEKEYNSYEISSPYVYTTVTIPDSIINKIVEKVDGVNPNEVKNIIHDELQTIMINLNKEKRSYVEIQRCKNCGYITKVEVKI